MVTATLKETEVASQNTASDRAYDLIKEKILLLELEPGSVINELELSKQIDLGRTPIRSALQRLERENLVVILPRQGTLVSDITLADFHEVFELRLELEGFAAFLAAMRAKTQHLEAFEELLAAAEQSAHAGNNLLDIEIDGRFHALIREIAANRYLQKTLEELFHHSIRLFNLSRTRSASVREEMPNYQAIYECLKNRDAKRARNWMREHIRASQERISASFVVQL
jgi:DNA-binding GntR family transcriptional regulator